ncbi:MAG: T9SS C-terminal target domain-containing protein [Ignavibacteriae bacterium]|nr:MAG: T9SS C-terminal target domain-containing protein [Ignavibacteriota bacterium]
MKTISTNSFGQWGPIFCLLIAAALILPNTTFSQWQGNPVSVAVNNQTNPMMTTDGSGGTIVTWQDKHNGKYEIYAQRMNLNGNAVWATNGIAICTLDSNYNPIIVSDGSGGAIIAWQSYRGSNTADIYAQRVNSSGAIQWTTNGVPVSVVVFEQDTIAMISDGLGGAILTWQDYRSNNGFADIYAQRVNPSGSMLWTANGVSICNQAAAQRGPKLVSDGSGGAFVTWYDNRAGNYDIYTQRIGSAGAVQWTTNGVATCTMATDQLKPDICSDGAAGVIIVWYDYRSTTDFNIYAQRQGPSGAIVWVVDGVVMNNNVAYAQIDPKIVSDGMSGAVMSWTDYRTGTTADIYSQRVNSTGAVQWTATGVIICTSANDQIKSQLVSDGNNGAYITWQDHRNAGNADIYAQRIASNAAIYWAATGYAICTAANDQLSPMIVSNGNLGAIVAWQDYRIGNNFDIYETGFNTNGFVAIENSGTKNPLEFSLSQNYPNPFNPVTVIYYDIPNAGNVKISIYDVLGRNVNTLVNGPQNTGKYKIEWDASSFPSGLYFYRLESGTFVSTRKMILIK